MLVLGFNGGPDSVQERGAHSWMHHDSACVLVEDGEVLFAIEEERLNRIKHTNKFPRQSMLSCLNVRNIRLSDVDLIAFYNTKESLDHYAKWQFLNRLIGADNLDGEARIQNLIYKMLNDEVDGSKLRFVHHHYAHATSAFALSGFDESLILTIDGLGDDASGMVLVGVEAEAKMEQVAEFPVSKSLGVFYVDVIQYLGFKLFDEYKVMGLAPYGDPARYRGLFKEFYTLLPEGNYTLHKDKLSSLFDISTPRRAGDPFIQAHMDIAASLQEALEEIVFHVVRYYSQLTMQKNLCMAGGVAHNCTLNGKLLRSGLFENIFVQPAAHDAGSALGSALYTYYQERPKAKRGPRMEHVYWGTDIGESQVVLDQLMKWKDFITVRKPEDICRETAGLLAGGSVVGWVQGRSEFGPRALGNRSILADPRPPENKDRINEMVKKREAYRPFAPSVLEECVGEFFHVPDRQKTFPFMIFVVEVKEDKREVLGAVTHVDGTARIQTVSKKTNEIYWRLIDSFKAITGVPILLNTSFNNNVEPIVDSVEDAVICYLTTKLDYLIVGDYLVTKKELSCQDYLRLKPSLPPYIALHQVKKLGQNGEASIALTIRNTIDDRFLRALSAQMYGILYHSDGVKTLKDIMTKMGETDDQQIQTAVDKLMNLWAQRLVILRPAIEAE
jgi:carbamoyltransferase